MYNEAKVPALFRQTDRTGEMDASADRRRLLRYVALQLPRQWPVSKLRSSEASGA